MIDILIKLHKTDFVLYEVFLFITFLIWYWTLFMDGANEWSQKVNDMWGKSMSHPTFFKIFMTLFLLGTLGGGYGIIINKIGDF